MDNAVALVQTYLRINGYFTVTEYPVVEAAKEGDFQSATDLDVLAFRFPGAGRLVPSRSSKPGKGKWISKPDPKLGVDPDSGDMLIGEVKEGKAQLNRGTRDSRVLAAGLMRFGCCSAEHADHVARDLIQKGRARTQDGHAVRLIAFGSSGRRKEGADRVILLSHIVDYVNKYLRQHWSVLHHAQVKEPGLGFLFTLEKARLGAAGQRRST